MGSIESETAPFAHDRQRLRDEAGDYIGVVFAILRDMGLPAVASIRMNDAHVSSDPKGLGRYVLEIAPGVPARRAIRLFRQLPGLRAAGSARLPESS